LTRKLMKKMETEKRSKNKIVPWDAHLDAKYGKHGTTSRTEFETKAHAFILGELLRDERTKAHLTQAALAEKTGTKKSYISRIENGHADIQLSTLFRLIEQGFNKKLELAIK
jgi:ribosome-binding protein aMBF1 (putative translation factor)